MNLLAFDTETELIRPGLLAPPMVCLTWQRPGFDPQIARYTDAKPRLKGWLEDEGTLVVGHFAAYDMAVVCAQFPDLTPLVFRAYRCNRVTCTKKRQQLLDIAGGVFRGRIGEKGRWITHEYTLEALSRRHLGKTMDKDTWRLKYGELREVPLSEWPAGAIEYPLVDAATTLGVYLSQEQHAQYLHDQYRQAFADFVLYLSSAWGLRTNAEGVEALESELREAHKELEKELQTLGLVRKDGTRDIKATRRLMLAVCRDNDLPVRRTDAHQTCELGDTCEKHVALDADACEAAVRDGRGLTGLGWARLGGAWRGEAGMGGPPEGAEALEKYAEFVLLGKMLSNDVLMLKAGAEYPIHTRYDLTETGRAASSRPNIQNLNTGRVRNVKSTAQRLRPGVRQAFVPRPGKVFAQADFPQLELYTLAQCCYSWLGESKLGEALNAGRDPHLDVAATILGIPNAEAAANKTRSDVDAARQVGKVFNFGKPGGLGNAKLIMFARKVYGVELTTQQCEQYTEHWHATFPEMRAYLKRINDLFGEEDQRVSVETLFTKRHRGGASFCAACNNGFQALGSDCAKAALCLIAEAEYCQPESPLFGARTVAFVHDEAILEVEDGPRAHDAAFELAHLMTVGANQYLPNVPIPLSKMKPVLMRCWDKAAKQVFENGRLVPWPAAA